LDTCLYGLQHEIITTLNDIMNKVNPIELGFVHHNLTYDIFNNINQTSVNYGLLKKCIINARSSLDCIDRMLNHFNNNQISNLPSLNERIMYVNKILDVNQKYQKMV